jgi:uncharacterized cupin superfamily protein
MANIMVLKSEGRGAPDPEHGEPSSDALISGRYVTKTWNYWTGEDGRLYCGIWDCSAGKVRIDYTEWEFCHLLEGEAVLTNDEGESWRLKKGDGFIIPPGFKGTWETVQPVRKHYVILTAKS